MTAQATKIQPDLNIVIMPDHTIIGGEILHPTTISLILENGHSYDFHQVLKLHTKHDKKANKGPNVFKRTGRFFSAVKQVIREQNEN